MQPPYISKTKLDAYCQLSTVKQRRKKNLFAVEGLKGILDVAQTYDTEVLIIADNAFQDIKCNIPSKIDVTKLRLITDTDMKRLSSLSTPPVAIGIFKMKEVKRHTLTDLQLHTLYLLLDGVRDPGNFGTIIRTADWFGIHTIFASRDSADLFNQKVIQSSMGSIAHVTVIYTDLPDLVLNNPDIPLYGTLLEGSNIYTTTLPDSAMIVMGNEGQGLSPEMRKMITQPLTIPPYSSIHGESLNVAVATAVVLSEFRRNCLCNPIN